MTSVPFPLASAQLRGTLRKQLPVSLVCISRRAVVKETPAGLSLRSWENWEEPDSGGDARLVTDVTQPYFPRDLSFRLLALLLGLWLVCSVTGQRVEMRSKVWKGRGCCCCVHQALEGGGGAKEKCLSSRSVASIRKSRPVPLPPPALPQQHLLVLFILTQGWVGSWAVKEAWVGWEDCVLQSLSCRLGVLSSELMCSRVL